MPVEADELGRVTDPALELKVSEALDGAHAAIVLLDQIALSPGQLPKVWYPDLPISPAPLLVTLHTDSLDSAAVDELQALQWLIDTAQQQDVDLTATHPRSATPPWLGKVPLLGTGKAGPNLRQLQADSLRPDWDSVRPEHRPRAAYVDLSVHLANGRHLMVSLDEPLLADALDPFWNRKTMVFRPSESRRYVDLHLKASGRYRVQPWNQPNRGLYYWWRLWNLIPAFQAAWPCVVFGEDKLPGGPELHDFMHALYARLKGQMEAVDRIGWLRYSPPNNDRRDELLNLMNYFIVLATGIFDSLAWLTSHRYNVKAARSNVTLRSEKESGATNPFFTALEHHAPALVKYLKAADVQAKIKLFYAPRDAIQHRLVLSGGRLITGQYLSDCIVVFLSKADAQPIQAVDFDEPANVPFTGWGLLTFADSGGTVLEPYRFTRSALRFLLDLVNTSLSHLDLSGWISAKPDLKSTADAVIVTAQQRNCWEFAVPFP